MAVDAVFTPGIGRRGWLLGCLGLAWLGCKSRPERQPKTVLDAYLDIGARLAQDEIDGVSKLGAALVVAAEPRQAEAGIAELIAATSRLGAGDINTVRLAYRKLSAALVEVLAAKPDGRAGLQLVYCPMAFANEGAYWVQREGRLRNPYEGTMMLRCGARVAWSDYRAGAAPAGEVELEGMK